MGQSPEELRAELHQLCRDMLSLSDRIKNLEQRIIGFETSQAAAAQGAEYCPGCGTEVRPNARFCKMCGLRVAMDEDVPDPTDAIFAMEFPAPVETPEPMVEETPEPVQALEPQPEFEPEPEGEAVPEYESGHEIDEFQEQAIPDQADAAQEWEPVAGEPETGVPEQVGIEPPPAPAVSEEIADEQEDIALEPEPEDLTTDTENESLSPAPDEPEPDREAVAAMAAAPEPIAPTREGFVPEPEIPGEAAPPEPVSPHQPVKLREAEIGTKWFGIAGIVLVVVSFAFFVKYAMDQGWIGPLLRVALGVLSGAAVVAIGNLFDKRKEFHGYARILIGGGFAIIYFSIYAAYYFYGADIAISEAADLVLLSVCVGCAIWFAVRMDSVILAGEAFLLGYATAYLCGVITLFTLAYNVVLAVGLVYLVWRKGWFTLGVAGLAATYFMHLVWLQANLDASLANMIFLMCYFALFTAVGVAERYYVLCADPNREATLAALPAESRYLLYAVAALNLFLPMSATPRDGIFLVYYLAVDIAVFAVALQFSMAGLGLAAAGINYYAFILWNNAHIENSTLAAVFLIGIYAGFTAYSFLMQRMERRLPYEEIILAFVNTFCFFAFLFTKVEGDFSDYAGLFTLGMSAINLGLYYLARRREFRTLVDTHMVLAVVFLTLAIPVQLTGDWLPLSWAAESVALVYLSFAFKNPLLRNLSRGVAVIALISLGTVDFMQVEMGPVFVGVTAACYLLRAWLYQKHLLREQPDGAAFWETCGYAVTAAALVGYYFFAWNAPDWQRFTALCVWGAALLGAGVATRWYWLHMGAFAVFIGTVAVTVGTLPFARDNALGILLPQILTYAACSLPLLRRPEQNPLGNLEIMGGLYEFAAVAFLTILLWMKIDVLWLPAAWAVEALGLLLLSFTGSPVMRRRYARTVCGLAAINFAILPVAGLDPSAVSCLAVAACFFASAVIYHLFIYKTQEPGLAFQERCVYAMAGAGVMAFCLFTLFAPDAQDWQRFAALSLWGAALLGAGIFSQWHWLNAGAFAVHAGVVIATVFILPSSRENALGVLLPQILTYAACSLPLIQRPQQNPLCDQKLAGGVYEFAAVALLTLLLWMTVDVKWLPAAWAAEALGLLLASFAGGTAMRRRYAQAVCGFAGMNYIVMLMAGYEPPAVASLAVAACFFAMAGIFHVFIYKEQQLDAAFAERCLYALAGTLLVTLMIFTNTDGLWLHYGGACLWGAALLAAGAVLRVYWLHIAGLTVHAVILMATYSTMKHGSEYALPVMLPQVIAYYMGAGILARFRPDEPFEQLQTGVPAYAAVSTLLLTLMLGLALEGHWISIAWACEAIGLLVAGVSLKHRIVRYAGMGLFALTLLKVLILDMARLDTGFRVISLFGVGLILLVASYLYYRYRDRIEELL